MPIRLAHTIVEDPKYGASRRDAVISVASAPMPAPNTSAPSARPPGLPFTAVEATLLQPEDSLDLAERSRCEQHHSGKGERENEPEPDPGPALLAMPPSTGCAASAVEPVRALDSVGIERWRLLLRRSPDLDFGHGRSVETPGCF